MQSPSWSDACKNTIQSSDPTLSENHDNLVVHGLCIATLHSLQCHSTRLLCKLCCKTVYALLHCIVFSVTIPAWHASYAASVFIEDTASTQAWTRVRVGQGYAHLSDCNAAYQHLGSAGCSSSLFSKDSYALPKLLNSAPRPSSPWFRAHSSPVVASDLVLGPPCSSLATPAWPQQTPSSVMPNLPVTPTDPLIPMSQPQQALLQPMHHGPSQRVLQGPLPAPLQAPLLPPSQPSRQVPFQLPFQEPFLDDLQLHDWHALMSALRLQT